MRNLFFAAVTLAVLITGSSCESQNSAKLKNITLKTSQDSLSYALGVNIGQSMKQQNLTDVNVDMMAKIISAILSGDTSLQMTNDQSMACINQFMVQQRKAEGDKNMEEGKEFLADNAKKEGVQTTSSGLQYKVNASGSGAMPVDGDQVTVNYTGKLLDGTIFDSSEKRGQPATFPVNGVIKGWTEALKMMHEGDKWTLYIPADLAYGPNGAGNVIPPNSTLIFDVELIKVIPKDSTQTKTNPNMNSQSNTNH